MRKPEATDSDGMEEVNEAADKLSAEMTECLSEDREVNLLRSLIE